MVQPSHKPFALITGASSGIGFELARQFAEHGYDLLVVAEDDAIHDAARGLQTAGTRVFSLRCDLATSAGVEQVVEEVHTMARPVDALAINAGVGLGGAFVSTDLASELRMIQLNIVSAVHLTKRLIGAMTAHRSGRILFTSSIAAVMPGPYEAVYAGTKAFLLSFAEALRVELKPHGISVTALMPGPTDTNFFHRAHMEDTKVGVSRKDDPADVARQGFEALMAGKDKVVAGSTRTKLLGLTSGLLPESVKAERHARMVEPGSGRRS